LRLRNWQRILADDGTSRAGAAIIRDGGAVMRNGGAAKMRAALIASVLMPALVCGLADCAEPAVVFSGARRRNNLVTELLEVASLSKPSQSFVFTRSSDGWIFLATTSQGKGTVRLTLDEQPDYEAIVSHGDGEAKAVEVVRLVTRGEHRVRVECTGGCRVERLVIKAIPELLHCGLGFDPAIRSYGHYDMEFLRKDILPNVTTLIVPSNIKLGQAVIDDWHRQGKRFVAEVGINAQAGTADGHYRFWAGFYDRSPFLDGIIVNEFIVNNPSAAAGGIVSPKRAARIDRERQRYRVFGDAIKKLRADTRYRGKMLYGYVGGSAKRLNREEIGPDFIRTIIDSGYRVALERYIFEVSSEQKSDDVLERFADGIADWEAKEPGVRRRMVVTFGLFSMPPGGINKQPNVDYHVWMDRQMNMVANHPALSDLAGLNWWTSLLADEETVRFVGKLYRHYAIDGKTSMLTRDPLFLTHIRNADFDTGLEGWTLRPAAAGCIEARGFPRYGRIEGRYMGLGRPADPEHIGDTFLWMKRSERGPNAFSQVIKGLEPGRLYSLKMFTCDYDDLIHPRKKTREQANPFIGRVELEGVELDGRRSFTEMYASSPEPPIPVWIAYHWKVFRAKAATAMVIVSDWPDDGVPAGPFGQEQTFNFVEIQPYHE
jgi:hypothetical protein